MPARGIKPVSRHAAKLLVRLPHDLHQQLKHEATEQGVSVNTLVVALLAGGLGFKLAEEQ
jgi:predicted HicB family RNase H-like nuclease